MRLPQHMWALKTGLPATEPEEKCTQTEAEEDEVMIITRSRRRMIKKEGEREAVGNRLIAFLIFK